MSNELEPKPTPSQPVIYQIRLKGHLDSQLTDWFEGLTITHAARAIDLRIERQRVGATG